MCFGSAWPFCKFQARQRAEYAEFAEFPGGILPTDFHLRIASICLRKFESTHPKIGGVRCLGEPESKQLLRGERRMEVLEIASFEDLRSYVRELLCRRGDMHQETPIVETPLIRRRKPCGVEFVLLGPRNERLSAIWEVDTGKLLCYDQNLERFHAQQLLGPPFEPQGLPLAETSVRCAWVGR